jgi:serine/threonine protein kinase
VLSGIPPFNDFSNEGIIAKIKRGKFAFEPTNIWDGISADAKDFISCCLTKDPSKRPSA